MVSKQPSFYLFIYRKSTKPPFYYNLKLNQNNMKTFNQYINGEFVKSSSTDTLEILNPCTEEVLSLMPKGSIKDAELALEAAQISQHTWKSLTAIERANY